MVIFISGSINSGKSTVSKILADKIDKSSVIEVDALRNFIPKVPLEEAIPINLENVVSIIKNFSKHKISSIIPYPISQKNYDFLMEELKSLEGPFYFFTLNPDFEIVSKDRGERKLTDWEKERIKYHYDIGINKPSFAILINNSSNTPDQTAEEILSHIK